MKRLFAAMSAAILLASLASGMVAAKSTTNLIGGQWRIWNVMPATSSYWDINKTTAPGQSFPVQQFQSTTTGSFAVYLMNNYNTSLNETQTLSTTAYWTPGSYETRSMPPSGAYGRFWFQDVTSGPFTSSDYWWYSGTSGVLDLSASTSASALVSVSAALSDRAHWSNICGQYATDTHAYPGTNCVGTTDPAVSPYDGFTNAMANVKEIGLSFGSGSRYASGIALDGRPGTFTMTAFTVTP